MRAMRKIGVPMILAGPRLADLEGRPPALVPDAAGRPRWLSSPSTP